MTHTLIILHPIEPNNVTIFAVYQNYASNTKLLIFRSKRRFKDKFMSFCANLLQSSSEHQLKLLFFFEDKAMLSWTAGECVYAKTSASLKQVKEVKSVIYYFRINSVPRCWLETSQTLHLNSEVTRKHIEKLKMKSCFGVSQNKHTQTIDSWHYVSMHVINELKTAQNECKF